MNCTYQSSGNKVKDGIMREWEWSDEELEKEVTRLSHLVSQERASSEELVEYAMCKYALYNEEEEPASLLEDAMALEPKNEMAAILWCTLRIFSPYLGGNENQAITARNKVKQRISDGLSRPSDYGGAYYYLNYLLNSVPSDDGETDYQIDQLRQSIAQQPSWSNNHWDLAILLKRAGNLNEARKHALIAKENQYPSNPNWSCTEYYYDSYIIGGSSIDFTFEGMDKLIS